MKADGAGTKSALNSEDPLSDTGSRMHGLEIESDDDDGDGDGDMSNPAEVFRMYSLQHEVAVARHRTYILHMNASVTSNPRVAVALSDQSCAIYDVTQLSKVETLCGHKGTVVNVRFSPGDESLVYSASSDGTIKLWDLRIGNQSAKEFKDDTEDSEKLKPLSDFDIAADGRFICGGTELIHDDAFLLFWDIRSTNLLGGYWESHTDDITQVCFHPTKPDTLASGSTDGLMNIFDISKACEEDALQLSLNTESSVAKIGWFPRESGSDMLSCITHTEDLQLWTSDGAYPFVQFSREKICHSMQRKLVESCFIVDAHQTNTLGEVLLLTTAGRGECLRTLAVNKNKLKPLSSLAGNKQIVRTSWYDRNSELLLTGGEGGLLSLWKPSTHSETDLGTNLKMNLKQKFKHHQKNPY
ncbi:WD repeat-containing protein 89 [Cryptotermes secundus]|uniref:WD repeat-containing protein 89 n=2 Tax=Cryptotermes secundus TaxID=105785 RepID=A0A2J7PHX0_9NEOP|nr:WD repeat-containing protein 89 isoform X2 [Cryptotermes secundus]PNF15923.1 WD repeat-containing protein 89 [Cryptotermes secundus]PNF15924.1 WD repeat-containing protein 89 [Cryptotermes secundus]